jgi:hypothetical protein
MYSFSSKTPSNMNNVANKVNQIPLKNKSPIYDKSLQNLVSSRERNPSQGIDDLRNVPSTN